MTGARRRWERVQAMASVALGALLLIACSAPITARAQSAADATPTPAIEAATVVTADDALRRAVEVQGSVYAGDCAATKSPQDTGKVCSKLVEQQGAQRAYLTGRTFSEFSRWVFVEQTPNGWRFAGEAPLDFFATSIEIPWPR